jgi:hypothetical protein
MITSLGGYRAPFCHLQRGASDMTDPIAPTWAINSVLRAHKLDQMYGAEAVVMGRHEGAPVLRLAHAMALMLAELKELRARDEASIPMVLHCPVCHMLHIDEVDEVLNPGWMNPQHVSHTCLGCGTVWRPSDRPTEGVAALERHGRSDTWPARGRNPTASHDTGGILVPLAPHLDAAKMAEAAKVKAASPAGKTPPPNCRDRMRAEGKAYPRSGCKGCSPTNKHKFTCPYLGETK